MTKPNSSSKLASTLFAALAYRDNRVFWIGTTISSVAQASFLVSAGWLAYEQGGGSATGMVAFATMFPFLLSTPIGGLLADRYDRRSIVLATQVFQGVLALLLGGLELAGLLPLPLLIALVLVSSAARTVELPTVGAVLPNLVPPRVLLNNLSLNSLATLGSRFAGPALLAPILALGGAGAAFMTIALLYLPALIWTRRTPPMPRGPITGASFGAQAGEAISYIRERGMVALLLALVVLHCWLTMSFDAVLPLVAEENLGGKGAIYSSLVAAGGIGAIVGSLVLAGLRVRTRRGSLLLASGIGSGVTAIFLAVSSVLPLAALAMVGVGLSQAMFMTLANTLVQEAVPDEVRGRVTSIFLMSAGGVMSFGNLANGTIADRIGVWPVLVLPGIAYIVILLAVSAARPGLRTVYREGALPEFTSRGAPVTAGD
ncbi:MAG TPA: MFS transporter [Thermomicrobiales bacterium]|nr:MFS transporter [Thermomicrobiales bacterium]